METLNNCITAIIFGYGEKINSAALHCFSFLQKAHRAADIHLAIYYLQFH